MGVYILLYGGDMQDHPEWEGVGISGSRDIVSALDKLPSKTLRCPEDHETTMYRPTDFQAWRAWMREADLVNLNHWLKLMDLLEADEADQKWWIYVSW